jgi:hypothetical protein
MNAGTIADLSSGCHFRSPDALGSLAGAVLFFA